MPLALVHQRTLIQKEKDYEGTSQHDGYERVPLDRGRLWPQGADDSGVVDSGGWHRDSVLGAAGRAPSVRLLAARWRGQPSRRLQPYPGRGCNLAKPTRPSRPLAGGFFLAQERSSSCLQLIEHRLHARDHQRVGA